MMAKKQSFFNSTFARTALPMFGFVLLCWYGLDQLMSSKLKIRQSVRGYDKVEEYDPMERLRRLEGAAGKTGGGSASQPGSSRATPGIKSLDEELEELKQGLDINNFDYKPVPRPADDEW